MLLGCVADGTAGAIAIAAALTRGGLRSVLLLGVPASEGEASGAEAVVIAEPLHDLPAADAVPRGLAALAWLRRAGCPSVLFAHAPGYGSPGDNSGAVADALVAAVGSGFAPVCPASPATAHTVYQGHLFAGSRLAERCDLIRALSEQTEGTVGLVPLATVAAGANAIRRALTAQKEAGRRYAVVDAVSDDHLRVVGAALAGSAVMLGHSGLAAGLAEALSGSGPETVAVAPAVNGMAAVLAGSCARTTLLQIGVARQGTPTLDLDPLETPDAAVMTAAALRWVEGRLGKTPVVIATSASPDRVAALRGRLGREQADAVVADTLAATAEGLVARGVRRLLLAGGDTAAAVLARLGVRSLRVTAEIDGVPWMRADAPAGPLLIAVKPGPSGRRDILLSAFEAFG